MPNHPHDRRPAPPDGARLLGGLEELAAALSGATDPASVGRCVVEVTQRTLGAERGAAYAVGQDGRLALIYAVASDGSLTADVDERRIVERGDPVADALLHGGVRVFDDPAEYAAAYPAADGSRLAGAGTIALLALGRTGSVSGVVDLRWPDRRAVGPGGRAFLGTIGRVASQAMDRVVAEERERRRAEGLSRTLAAVAGQSRLGDVAGALLREAMPAADAAYGAVRLLSTGELTTLVAEVGYAARPPYIDLPVSVKSPATDAILAGEPVLLPSPEAIATRYPRWAATFDLLGPRASASLPITSGGRAIGSLTLGWREPQAFDAGQLAHVRALADAASVALERARATEEEGRLRQLLAETLRQLPVGVIVAEPTAGLVFQSDEVARLLGGPLPLGRLDGLGLTRTLPDGTPLTIEDWPISRALRGESVEGFETLVRRLDDRREVRIESSARPVLRDGRVSAAVSVLADVTDARAAAEARDAFLGVLSHELRTPLTSVYGGALVLAKHRDEVPSTFEPVVAGIADEAARLLRLVEDLLVLARIERGVQLASLDTISLSPALRRATRAEAARWPGVEVSVRVDEATPPVLADEGPLEVVVRNLVGNAAKYGAHRVEVTAAREGARVAVRVADDGPGLDLPPTELFTLFRRGPAAARRASGSGIGLYVCQALVRAMWGEITGANRAEGGAEFTVLLAAAEDEEDQ